MSHWESAFGAGFVSGLLLGAVAVALSTSRPGYVVRAIQEKRSRPARADRAAAPEDTLVDEAIDESFPASDPPAWSPSTTRSGA